MVINKALINMMGISMKNYSIYNSASHAKAIALPDNTASKLRIPSDRDMAYLLRSLGGVALMVSGFVCGNAARADLGGWLMIKGIVYEFSKKFFSPRKADVLVCFMMLAPAAFHLLGAGSVAEGIGAGLLFTANLMRGLKNADLCIKLTGTRFFAVVPAMLMVGQGLAQSVHGVMHADFLSVIAGLFIIVGSFYYGRCDTRAPD
jgi:hypothetical protein